MIYVNLHKEDKFYAMHCKKCWIVLKNKQQQKIANKKN